MLRNVTLAVIAVLLAGCSNDSERIEELEQKIEQMESQRQSLAGGPAASATPGAAPTVAPSPNAAIPPAPPPGARVAAAPDADGNVCSDGRERHLTLVNNGDQAIMYFYASPPSAGSWEEDVLGDDVVSEGERFRINFNTDERCTCTYDTRAVMADDSEVIRKVSVCDDHTQNYP